MDLSNALQRKKLVAQIQADIDSFCRYEFVEEPRKHLGASIIGESCSAKLWGIFRWLKQEDFDGRMLRLFNRGHTEENRFIRWLQGIGFEVRDLDPETKRQFRIVGCKGHFGGSLDAMMKAPARYGLSEDLIFLGEFKTHNDKSFNELKKYGVTYKKPMHFSQMSAYGRAYGYKYALYCAVNKNTDELYFEIVELDWSKADDCFRKADGIVFSQVQPMKIAQTPLFADCKYCFLKDICFNGEVPEKNCRSCRNASPVENAQWFCAIHNAIIPDEVIAVGCDSYARIV